MAAGGVSQGGQQQPEARPVEVAGQVAKVDRLTVRQALSGAQQPLLAVAPGETAGLQGVADVTTNAPAMIAEGMARLDQALRS